jgi:Flp pilus assembly pilin Flp
MLHEPGGLDVTTLALRRLRRGESGATALELALVLPLLITLLFGIIEFGRAMATYSTVVTASREAARFGSTVGTTGGVVHYRDCARIRAAGDHLNIMAAGADVQIWFDEGPNTSEVARCGVTSDLSKIEKGHRVVVEMTQPFYLAIPFLPEKYRKVDISATDHRTIGGQTFGGGT